ncbi:Hypothetical_protein [Hexamita inflata]|uniref:Hypothetical_protein n=1 Tax=Hexamita inflata TaxID=28002 RepID=A0AA86RH83_9EUKA|nr:Hypothetical protein HINF_LOCUS60232 [Hexamita inflata]
MLVLRLNISLFCWEFGDIGRFLGFVLGNNQQQSAIKTLKIKTGRFPARNRRIRPGLTHQISFYINEINIFQAFLESLKSIREWLWILVATNTLVQLRFNLWEVSQLLNDTQHQQQHIDSAPRWRFKVEQRQEYGFGSENYIQLLDMTLERSISVTEVWQFHCMQQMI